MHYPVATVGFVIAPRGVGTMIGMFLVGRIINPVPAVTEAAAIGDIAEIFADIRRVLGVGVVNLIWRHLATIPGALPWAWEQCGRSMSTARSRPRRRRCTMILMYPNCLHFPRKSSLRRAFFRAMSTQSVRFSRHTTGRMQWPSSLYQRCCAGWTTNRSPPKRRSRAAAINLTNCRLKSPCRRCRTWPTYCPPPLTWC